MQEQPSHRHYPLGFIAGGAVLILATGSAVAWWTWNTVRNPAIVEQTHQQGDRQQSGQNAPPAAPFGDKTQNAQPKSATANTEKALQTFWLKGSGQKLELVATPVKLSATGNPDASLKAALEQLLAGPGNAAVTTTIPRNTRLLDLALRDDGIHINLSQEFTTGGGSTSMTARVGQVLYTATSLNPDRPVWLVVNGKPLAVLGGEGLMLDQPLTRKTFERDFPL